MRKLIFAINMSLDGYADHTIADGGDDLHDFFSSLLDQTGIELLGRVTYQMMEGYWPHVPKNPSASHSDLVFAEKFNSVPKVVFSKTLTESHWSNSTLIKTDAAEYVRELKKGDGKNLFVGGIALANSLSQKGLIDEYWLVIHPVVAGKGRRLFEDVSEMMKLKLVETRTLKSGAIALHLIRVTE